MPTQKRVLNPRRLREIFQRDGSSDRDSIKNLELDKGPDGNELCHL